MQADTTSVSKDFTVSFLDFDAKLDSGMTIVYKEINDFLNAISDVATTGDIFIFRGLMVNLRDGLIDQTNTKSNVVSLKDYYDTHSIQLSSGQSLLLQDIFTKLTDKSVSAAD